MPVKKLNSYIRTQQSTKWKYIPKQANIFVLMKLFTSRTLNAPCSTSNLPTLLKYDYYVTFNANIFELKILFNSE